MFRTLHVHYIYICETVFEETAEYTLRAIAFSNCCCYNHVCGNWGLIARHTQAITFLMKELYKSFPICSFKEIK